MSRKKSKKDYNYKQITITFDLDTVEEKDLFDFLNKNKRKKNGYGVQIKRALKVMIDML